MKTKKIIFKSILAITFAVFIIEGCKKKEEPAPVPVPVIPFVSPTDSSSHQKRADDQSNIENQSNQAIDDANSTLMGVSTTRTSCGMTVDSSQKADGIITMNYDGTVECLSKKRSGSITLKLKVSNGVITRWSTPGAKLELTYNSYKVTYLPSNKSIIFNGTHSMTDVTGYTLLSILNGTTILCKIRGSMQITYDDGSQRTINTARTRSYDVKISYPFPSPSDHCDITESGDSTLSGIPNTAFWGYNRVNDYYTVVISEPIKYKTMGACLYKPKGIAIITWGTHQITINYGVPQNGPYPDAASCPWGVQYMWTFNSVSYSFKLPYNW